MADILQLVNTRVSLSNITVIDSLGGGASAYGINNRGDFVGGFQSGSVDRSFMYSSGAVTLLDIPGGNSSLAFGINDAGTIVGSVGAPALGFPSSGFILQRGTPTTFSMPGLPVTSATYFYGINNRDEVAGAVNDGFGYTAIVFSGGSFRTIDVPGAAKGSVATGINDRGVIVGGFNDENNVNHTFVYNGSSFRVLDIAGAQMNIWGINNLGQLVGNVNINGATHGLLCEDDKCFYVDVPGSSVTYLQGINDHGEIVGSFGDERGLHPFAASITFRDRLQ